MKEGNSECEYIVRAMCGMEMYHSINMQKWSYNGTYYDLNEMRCIF